MRFEGGGLGRFKKLHMVFILAAAFSVLFLTVYLAIFLTQSANSKPLSAVSIIDNMEIALGPSPNSTNVSLDTAITVDALASAALEDLQLTPEVRIARVYSEVTSPLTYLNTFYPAGLLEPGTTYTVFVTIMDLPVSWTFTTTAEPFKPGIGYLLSTNGLWISLAIAASATVAVGYAVWFKPRKAVG